MTAREIRPLDPGDPDVRRLALIELALQRGMPWSAIATALGARDKQHAKQIKARLEKRVRGKQTSPARSTTATGCEPLIPVPGGDDGAY